MGRFDRHELHPAKGFALVYFLLVTAIVILLISTLFSLSRRQLFTTQNGRDRTRALYAAESVAYLMAELERDVAWTAGFSNFPVPDSHTTFSASFGLATNQDSCINNLTSDSAVDSYHGTATVPPRSALLVVTGRSGLVERKIEVLVVNAADVSKPFGILASGTVTLGGDVSVDRRLTLTETQSLPVGIHSNSLFDGTTILQPSSTDPALPAELTLSGRLTASSENVSAINLQGSLQTIGGREVGVPVEKIPNINIEALIADHASLPAPPPSVVGGVTLISHDNFHSGDLLVQGDLIFENDAKLYVNGSISVNGSIGGAGGLIVHDNTEVHGDFNVNPEKEHYVSLLSRGHIVLKGFQGQSLLNSEIVSDPSLAPNVEALNYALDWIQAELATLSQTYRNNPAGLSAALNGLDRDFDARSALISYHEDDNSAFLPAQYRPPSPQANALVLRDRYTGSAFGSTRHFLEKRFRLIGDVFRDARYRRDDVRLPNPVPTHMNFSAWDPLNQGGFFDFAQTTFFGVPQAQREQAFAAVQEFDVNRLGAAHFKGFVYTEGALVVKDDLNVLGTIVVNGDPARGVLAHDLGVSNPGDIFVSGHSRVVYVDELVEEGIKNLSGAGTLDIKRWTNRS